MGDRGVGGARLRVQRDKFVAVRPFLKPLPFQDDAEPAQVDALQLDGCGRDREEPLLQIDDDLVELGSQRHEVFIDVAYGTADAGRQRDELLKGRIDLSAKIDERPAETVPAGSSGRGPRAAFGQRQ